MSGPRGRPPGRTPRIGDCRTGDLAIWRSGQSGAPGYREVRSGLGEGFGAIGVDSGRLYDDIPVGAAELVGLGLLTAGPPRGGQRRLRAGSTGRTTGGERLRIAEGETEDALGAGGADGLGDRARLVRYPARQSSVLIALADRTRRIVDGLDVSVQLLLDALAEASRGTAAGERDCGNPDD